MAALEMGALTSVLLDRYCVGVGCEIGPGGHPYTATRSSFLIDKFLPVDNPFGTPIRIDLLADAGALAMKDGGLDYLMSSHCLEHHWDTIEVLLEWTRILRPGGFLFLVLPHKERTFDVTRPVTSVEHHVADFEHVDALDDAHWRTWEAVLDAFRQGHVSTETEDACWLEEVARDDGTYDRRFIADRGLIHYHAWTQNELLGLLRLLDLRVHIAVEEMHERRDSFLVVAERPEDWSGDAIRERIRANRLTAPGS